jgi:uncharacterized protein
MRAVAIAMQPLLILSAADWRSPYRWCLLATAMAATCGSLPATAQPTGLPTPLSPASAALAAANVFNQAVAAMNAGRDDEALRLLEGRGEAAQPEEMLLLGVLLEKRHERGAGTLQDRSRAAAMYERARSAQPAAAFRLALLLDNGLGVPRDPLRATELFRDAADRGEPNALYFLGLRMQHGTGGVPQDLPGAVALYRRAAASGQAHAMVMLGWALRTGKGVEAHPRAAFEWVRQAAATGLPEAQVQHGDDLNQGTGTAPDKAQAFAWWSKAAERGNPLAMARLGVAYGRGEGVAKDEAKAFQYYTRAAEKNVPEAQHNLAQMYRDGLAVEKNIERALSLWEAAARQDHWFANLELAQHRLHGLNGAVRDPVQGYRWLLRMKNRGVRMEVQGAGAGNFIDVLVEQSERTLTPQQIELGRALAAEDARRSGGR